MKWLIWSSFFPPHIGGYEKNVFELAKRLVEAGDEVTVITSEETGYVKQLSVSGIDILRLPCWRLLGGTYPLPKPSRGLLAALRTKADVVSTQTRFFPMSLIGAVGSWLSRTPLIHTERGTQHTAVSNPVIDKISRLYDHTAGAWIVSRAARTVGVSTAACDFLAHIRGTQPERIPNGIAFAPPMRQAGEVPVILYVGRLIWAKGVQDLIMAVKALDRTLPWRLVIIGDGPYRKALETLISDDPRIRCLGSVVGDKLSELYARASVFVNPSYSEGLPTSVLEAAAAGCPIVATDVGGTREIVQHRKTGILVEPKDTLNLSRGIEWVLRNCSEAEQMGSAAQDNAKRNFSWEPVVSRYQALAESICRVE